MCARLGLRADEASTQVIQRDRHAEYMTTLAVVASTLDKMATEIRHLARTEVREVQEPFAAGAEGLLRHAAQAEPGRVRARERARARGPRSRAGGARERGALARARHLALVGRAASIFPDATGLLDFMLADMAWVMDGLVVFPERMAEHVMALGGIAFSQSVLLALVDAGSPRDDAYRIVQRAAAAAWDEGGVLPRGDRRRSRGARAPRATSSSRRSSTRGGSCGTSAGSSSSSRSCRWRAA